MNEVLSRSWWMLALAGVVSVVFGVVAIVFPVLTLLWLVAMFAVYAAFSGVVYIMGAIQNRHTDNGWWLFLLLGLMGIAAGVLAIIYPAITALVLVAIMGASALVQGVFQIAIAIRLRKVIEGEWLMMLAGAISIAFGVMVLLFPGAGALAMVWLVSFQAIVSGILLLMLGLRARSWKQRGGSAATLRAITPA